MLSTGTWHRGSGETAPVIEPATGDELGRYPLADRRDAEEALARAEANVEAFTDAHWVTLAGEIPPYPF